MRIGQYSRVLFDPDPAGGGEPPAPAPNPAPTPEPKQELKPAAAPKGEVIPLSTYEEKKAELLKDLSSVRGKNKDLEGKLSEAEKKVAAYELKEKKSTAFDAAVAALGEDFELPTDKLTKVKAFLDELPDSETLNEKVVEFLDLVKAPKAKPAPVKSPFSPNAPPAPKDGNKPLSQTELLQLAAKDPEAFKEALRKQA